MNPHDDEPVAGLLGALVTAIAMIVPAYLPEEAREWVDEDSVYERRYVSGPHLRRDEPSPIERAGTSTVANDGLGGEDEVLLAARGALRAPDEICVDIRLSPGRKRSLRLRVETTIPSAAFVSMGNTEIVTQEIRSDEGGDACGGEVQVLELARPKRRRHARIDVDLLLVQEDGALRSAHRSFTSCRASSSSRQVPSVPSAWCPSSDASPTASS